MNQFETVELLYLLSDFRLFTGHQITVASHTNKQFFLMLKQEYPALNIRLLTSLARGADTLVAEVASEMNIKVTNLLPNDSFFRLSFSHAESCGIHL